MINELPKNKDSKTEGELLNEKIRFPKVRLIGPEGEQLGIVSSKEAQLKANQLELDLLCVSPNSEPPVCKIINYGKYRFEQQKKAKEAKKNQHQTLIKEVRLTPQIGAHDITTKAKAATGFLLEGNKVKVSVKFKGRQLSHVDIGEETLNNFINALSEYGQMEKSPSLEGKWLSVVISPKKRK